MCVSQSILLAGDLNGDGFSDIVIGSVGQKQSVGVLSSFVIYGGKSVSIQSIAAMSASQGLVVPGAGVIVAGVGDLNGDGFDDVMLGANYGFDSGGGFVVHKMKRVPIGSSRPTMTPSLAPSCLPTRQPTSVRPTLVPSQPPTQTPTRPTVIPSIAPSGPTHTPTLTPTQPTSIPTARPSAPTVTPSMLPSTAAPSAIPSEFPTVTPSETPSFSPTVLETRWPTSLNPSTRPTIKATLNPTHFPVVRPIAMFISTAMPTVYEPPAFVVTYKKAVTVDSGIHIREQENTIYSFTSSLVNVTIRGVGGDALFKLSKSPGAVATIINFNVSKDIINFETFPELKNISCLNMTSFTATTNTRRRLRGNSVREGKSLIITFGESQKLILTNVSSSDLKNRNLQFVVPDTDTTNCFEDDFINIFLISMIVCGFLFLYLVFQCYLNAEELYRAMVLYREVPVDWSTAGRGNPTYLSFVDGSSASLNDFSVSSEASVFSNLSEWSLELSSENEGGSNRKDSSQGDGDNSISSQSNEQAKRISVRLLNKTYRKDFNTQHDFEEGIGLFRSSNEINTISGVEKRINGEHFKRAVHGSEQDSRSNVNNISNRSMFSDNDNSVLSGIAYSADLHYSPPQKKTDTKVRKFSTFHRHNVHSKEEFRTSEGSDICKVDEDDGNYRTFDNWDNNYVPPQQEQRQQPHQEEQQMQQAYYSEMHNHWTNQAQQTYEYNCGTEMQNPWVYAEDQYMQQEYQGETDDSWGHCCGQQFVQQEHYTETQQDPWADSGYFSAWESNEQAIREWAQSQQQHQNEGLWYTEQGASNNNEV